MFGDMILFIRNQWKQFWCIHNYKVDGVGIATGLNCSRICSKCGKFER